MGLLALACSALTLSSPASASTGVGSAVSGPEPHVIVAVTTTQHHRYNTSYTVRRGDTLSSIARRHYGSAGLWPALWWANRGKVANPNVIRVGEQLVLRHHVRSVSATVYRKAVAAQNPAGTAHRSRAPPTHTATTTTSHPQRHARDHEPDGDGDDPNPSPAQPVSAAPVAASGFEACVIARESGGDPTAINPTSGASGLYGMLLSTWDSLGLGYPGGAYTAPPSVQHEGFLRLYARDGPAPWAPYDGC